MIWSDKPDWLTWQTWLAFMALSYALFVVAKRFTNSGQQIRLQRGNFGQEISLRQALANFFSHPTAVGFALLVAGLWGLRLGLMFLPGGQCTWNDLYLGVMMFAIWPLVEWIVHYFVLHAKPLRILGYTFDPLFAQIHRAHHRDPYHQTFGIVPLATLVHYGLLIPGTFALFVHWPRPVTMGAVVATMAFRYELWHYLIHSAYKPRSAWFRALRDRHWWHHFQHEGYWYGITTFAGDVILGTDPLPHEVPKSPTARTLGHDAPAEPPLESPSSERTTVAT